MDGRRWHIFFLMLWPEPANARSRAAEVAARHPKRRPDSFRLTDATGKVFGVFPIYARGDDVH